MYIFTFLNIR